MGPFLKRGDWESEANNSFKVLHWNDLVQPIFQVCLNTKECFEHSNALNYTYMKEACGGWGWNSGELKTSHRPTGFRRFRHLGPTGENKTKQNRPSLTARKPVLTAGLSSPGFPTPPLSLIFGVWPSNYISHKAVRGHLPFTGSSRGSIRPGVWGFPGSWTTNSGVLTVVTCGLVAEATSWRAQGPFWSW